MVCFFSGATMVKGIEGVTKVYVNPYVAEVINFRNGYVINNCMHFSHMSWICCVACVIHCYELCMYIFVDWLSTWVEVQTMLVCVVGLIAFHSRTIWSLLKIILSKLYVRWSLILKLEHLLWMQEWLASFTLIHGGTQHVTVLRYSQSILELFTVLNASPKG
jgi:hypothetical protein